MPGWEGKMCAQGLGGVLWGLENPTAQRLIKKLPDLFSLRIRSRILKEDP